jgi:hypothetical protein
LNECKRGKRENLKKYLFINENTQCDDEEPFCAIERINTIKKENLFASAKSRSW